jgi:hypothetical protein
MPAVTTLIGHPVYSQDNYWTVPADTRQRILVLDVRERAFVIYIDAYRHQFEAFIQEAEQVLETLKFLDTTTAAPAPTESYPPTPGIP